jgi:hypothetical protein
MLYSIVSGRKKLEADVRSQLSSVTGACFMMCVKFPCAQKTMLGFRLSGELLACRLRSLELSQRKVIRSAHHGGVTWMDLDPVESRYLLAGASDASIAVYDTQQLTPPGAVEGTDEPGGAPPPTGVRRGGVSSGNAAGTGTTWEEEHHALLTVTRHTDGAHRFAVSSVAWYPIDAGLFVSGEGGAHTCMDEE